jgi:hypothetical protein
MPKLKKICYFYGIELVILTFLKKIIYEKDKYFLHYRR